MICSFFYRIIFTLMMTTRPEIVNKMIYLSSCATQLMMINFLKNIATEGWVHSVVPLFSVVLTLFTIQAACTNTAALIWQPGQGGERRCLLTLPLMMLEKNTQGSGFTQKKWFQALNYQRHNKALHSVCITFWAAVSSCASSLRNGICRKVFSSRDTLLYWVMQVMHDSCIHDLFAASFHLSPIKSSFIFWLRTFLTIDGKTRMGLPRFLTHVHLRALCPENLRLWYRNKINLKSLGVCG